MAKGQKRGNRELRKPKQLKKKPVAISVGAAGRNEPVKAAFTARLNGAKQHS